MNCHLLMSDAWITRIASWRCVDYTHRWWAMRGLHASLVGDACNPREAGRVIHAKRGVRFQRGVVDLTSNCSIKYKLLTNKRTSDKPLKNCHCDAFLAKNHAHSHALLAS